MEIKTCEQYVLAQLFDQQDENDMLNRELKCRDERIDELTGQIDAIEAAHAACDMLASIGEDTPAAEELAYMVQSITAGIIIACEGRSDG